MRSPSSGKFERSAVYLSTKGDLPTERLIELLKTRSSLAQTSVDREPAAILELLQFRRVISLDELKALVSFSIPRMAVEMQKRAQPLKLLVIDSLPPLVASAGAWNQRNRSHNIERAQILSGLGALLNTLARQYNFAILVVNEVKALFTRNPSQTLQEQPFTIANPNPMYTHAEYFSRTPKSLVTRGMLDDTARKEAHLGVGWAYQIAARIMLSRTSRKRPIKEDGETPGPHFPAKRRRIENCDDSSALPATTLVAAPQAYPSLQRPSCSPPSILCWPAISEIPISLRNLTVLFSKYGPSRNSVDFFILRSGIETIADTACNLEDGKIEFKRPSKSLSQRNLSSKLGAKRPNTPARIIHSQPETRVSATANGNLETSRSMGGSDSQDLAGFSVQSTPPPGGVASNFAVGNSLSDDHANAEASPSSLITSQPLNISSSSRSLDWEFYFPEEFDADADLDSVVSFEDAGAGACTSVGPCVVGEGRRGVDSRHERGFVSAAIASSQMNLQEIPVSQPRDFPPIFNSSAINTVIDSPPAPVPDPKLLFALENGLLEADLLDYDGEEDDYEALDFETDPAGDELTEEELRLLETFDTVSTTFPWECIGRARCARGRWAA
jgi:hypothetical protein